MAASVLKIGSYFSKSHLIVTTWSVFQNPVTFTNLLAMVYSKTHPSQMTLISPYGTYIYLMILRSFHLGYFIYSYVITLLCCSIAISIIPGLPLLLTLQAILNFKFNFAKIKISFKYATKTIRCLLHNLSTM